MTNLVIKVLDSGVEKYRHTGSETVDFAMATVSGTPTNNNDVMTKASVAAAYIPLTQKGANSGVATLDSGGKIPAAQLPNSIMEYKGNYNPTTNTPKLADTAVAASKIIQDITYTAVAVDNSGNDITIEYTGGGTAGSEVVTVVGNAISIQIESGVSTATQVKAAFDLKAEAVALASAVISGTGSNAQTTVAATNLEGGLSAGNAGDVYRVTAAGSHDFGSGSISFVIGDYIIYNGTVWEKSHSGADAVVSVNSQTGAVVLDTDDISDSGATNKYYTASTARSDLIAASISDGDTTHAPDGNSVFDALAGKSDVGHDHSGVYAPVSHAHAISDVTGLQDALDGKVSTSDSSISATNDNANPITIRQAVYLKSDGHVDLAKADAIATCGAVVGLVAATSIASGAAGLVFVKPGEKISGFTGLTIGAWYYVSAATAGELTATPPAATVGNVVKPIGFAVSGSVLMYLPGASAEVVS